MTTIKAKKNCKRAKPQSIMLVGRRWFQRTYGNTYHTVTIYVDGVCVHSTDKSYGYGDQWIYTGRDWLFENGYLDGIEQREGTPGEHLRMYCERMKIAYEYSVCDVAREKDL